MGAKWIKISKKIPSKFLYILSKTRNFVKEQILWSHQKITSKNKQNWKRKYKKIQQAYKI